MSRFRIFRIDHYDPVSVGKKNRFLFTIYGIIPTLFVLSFNLGHYGGLSYCIRLLISIPLLALIYFFLLKKMRSTIDNLKTIGEIEITQSGLKKRIGDSVTEYSFQLIKEIKLIKHIPATRIRESKSRYFSYILKILFHNKPEESLVVSDRSVDHNQKISITETMKTLKKIAPFDVTIEI
jgi:hypothetical protein